MAGTREARLANWFPNNAFGEPEEASSGSRSATRWKKITSKSLQIL